MSEVQQQVRGAVACQRCSDMSEVQMKVRVVDDGGAVACQRCSDMSEVQ